MQKYPLLKKYINNFAFKYTPRGPGSHLETFPPGETGTAQYPRPKEFPNDRYGIDIYDSEISPEGVMGDAMIHGLRRLDPHLDTLYTQFQNIELNDPRQYAKLIRDYKHAQLNEGERRDFMTWATTSRINELFGTDLYIGDRGSQITPMWRTERFTPTQKRILDQVHQYITRPQ